MKNIRSRIGWELLLLIFVILSIASFPDIGKQQWRNLLVPAVIFAFVLLMCLSIRYRIDHQYLYIVNSLFGTEKINVNAIYKIEKTWNMLSAPAPGIFGRVEIYYNNSSIVIAPGDFNQLKSELLKINPNITVKE